jgi:hypothetical protein
MRIRIHQLKLMRIPGYLGPNIIRSPDPALPIIPDIFFLFRYRLPVRLQVPVAQESIYLKGIDRPFGRRVEGRFI